MYFRKLMLILCLGISAIPTVVSAQPFALSAGPIGAPLPMSLMMIIKQANLSQEQQAKVHQIMSSSFAQAQPLMKQLHDIHDQIGDKLMTTGAVTASDIAPLQRQENQIQYQLEQQMLSAALRIRGLLTPQQLAQAANLHNKLKSLRQQMDALMGNNGPVMFIGGPPPGL
jgi:Spy/CpxP family protein refolding chaperone